MGNMATVVDAMGGNGHHKHSTQPPTVVFSRLLRPLYNFNDSSFVWVTFYNLSAGPKIGMEFNFKAGF